MKTRLVALLFALSLFGPAALPLQSAPVAAANANLEQFANVNLPGDLGQTSLQVYFPQTEHTLRGYFLDYWRANGGESVYGLPISEPFAAGNGLYSQAFENGIFQFVLEMVWTDLPSVTLMPVGQRILDDRAGAFREDGRRGNGGGDRRSAAWKSVDPSGVTASAAINAGGTWSETTGHTISGAFYDWYVTHEGYYYLGEPISQPVRERGLTIQYFQGAILMEHPETGVRLAPLGSEMAGHLGIDLTPASSSGLPVYDESLFYTVANPNPLGDLYAPGKRSIHISISQQLLTAYQGDTIVTQTLVSTGLAPNNTERGHFHVRYKLKKQDMAGTVDSSGAVVAMGEEAANEAGSGARANEEAYVVKDVPNVMYFNYDAEALHGAYWHNNFGNPMSHGCVNLPLQMAEFLYGWAPLGTEVIVTE
ncbi:MAG: L,D-transpeptidase [Thermomicrobiales bacterium]|nr:L,D-transpeptidase [Thermomicrobiales bacterium]